MSVVFAFSSFSPYFETVVPEQYLCAEGFFFADPPAFVLSISAQEKIAGTNSADTALVAAVSQGRTEVVRLLLQSGRVRAQTPPLR